MGILLLVGALGLPATFAQHSGFPVKHEKFLIGHDQSVFEPQFASAGVAALGALTSSNGIVVGTNVRVNAQQTGTVAGGPLTGLFGRTEDAIVSTDDGLRIVVGYNFADGFQRPPFNTVNPRPGTPGLSGFSYSRNGGQTWTDGGAVPLFTISEGTIVTRGDPWLALGEGERVLFANIAVDPALPASQFPLGISVHRGHFTATGFMWDDVRLLQPQNYPQDFYDKESITMGRGNNRRFGYVTLTNFIETCGIPAFGFGQIELWRTNNGGDNWEGPIIVSPDISFDLNPNSPTCGQEGVEQQASTAAIGPGGQVYVLWERGPTDTIINGSSTDVDIVVARSLNRGQTFDTPVKIATINSMGNNPPVGFNRFGLIDHPRIAVDAETGRVYVVYYGAVSPATSPPIVTCPAGTADGTLCVGQSIISSQVFISFSDDQGLTWSTGKALAPAVAPTGLKRFFPVVTTGENGTVAVVYQESAEVAAAAPCNMSVQSSPPIRRVGAASSMVNTFIVVSQDGGSSFSKPVRVSTVTSKWCTTTSNVRPNFGDYTGSVGVGNKVFPVWGDSRLPVPFGSGQVNPPDTFFAPITITTGVQQP